MFNINIDSGKHLTIGHLVFLQFFYIYLFFFFFLHLACEQNG